MSKWTIEQLDIRRYQHILEIGFGSGRRLQQVARMLEVGFLAGLDASVTMYQQTYRRHEQYIQDQFLALHLGQICDLPYPSHYFHTIYANDGHHIWKDPVSELIRLYHLLKRNGRLVMVFQPLKAAGTDAVQLAADRMEEAYKLAGLSKVQVAFNELGRVTCISVIGHKA